MRKSVFEFEAYREYLRAYLEQSPKMGRGLKSAMAKAMGCQATYVTLVLKEGAHLSLEQAIRLNTFLTHSEAEGNYFLLLVQHGRAGSAELRRYFERLICNERAKWQQLQGRLNQRVDISDLTKQIYYSAWQYAAIHVISSIPHYQTPEAIAELLGLSSATVSEIVTFLVEKGFLERQGHRVRNSQRQVHLPHDSPLVAKHHANWRFYALNAIQRLNITDGVERLHYSAVLSLSYSAASHIRAGLLDHVMRVNEQVHNSDDEVAYSFVLDFFPMGKGC